MIEFTSCGEACFDRKPDIFPIACRYFIYDGALEDRIKNIFSTVPPSDKFIARNNITTILTTKRADYNVKKVIYI